MLTLYIIVATIDLLAMALTGIVLTWIWHWFAFPFGLTPIPFSVAIGMTLVAHLLVPVKDDLDDDLGEIIVRKFARPIILLLFGLAFSVFV